AAGGFINTAQAPVGELLASEAQRAEWLDAFSSRGIRIAALNVNGNPLHPDDAVGPAHLRAIEEAIAVAPLLGIDRIVAMPGALGSEPQSTRPSWYVIPWESGLLDACDFQWEVAIPVWKRLSQHAETAGVRLCVEPHPNTIVYNPDTVVRLLETVDSDHLEINLDPSHFFWQGIDTIAAIDRLSGKIWQAAAKDTLIDAAAVARHGVLDNRFRTHAGAFDIGGGYSITEYPDDAAWRFVAAGRGHDVAWWAEFTRALQRAGYDESISIELEDRELSPDEGVKVTADTLQQAITLAATEGPA
ncbi:MAG: sugar phosphate isomerase/epimerase family protein, partial [Propioniciclava sp.]